MDDLLGLMSPEIRYEDVPTAAVYRGHVGVREMAAQAHQLSNDMTFEAANSSISGNCFAFEHHARGTNTGAIGPLPGTGKPFTLRGVAFGVLADGLVIDHRDYWDLAGLLGQVGV
jgi:hypothetical protein